MEQNATIEKFDIVVIGAGSAGLSAAEVSNRLGLKTALIEKERVGGDCTWTGCVPSKALIKAAKVAHNVRNAGFYGTQVSGYKVDMAAIKKYVYSVVSDVYSHETPEVLTARGMEVILGAAEFIDEKTLVAAGRTIHAKHYVLATGAHPFVPPIDGINDVDFHTYKTIFDNERLPEHLIVIGAGPIGSEMAQAYARFGANVTLIDVGLFQLEEPEVAKVFAPIFEREGISFVEGLVERAAQQGDQITVVVNGQSITGDMLLMSVGRAPNVKGLDLEKGGIAYSNKGIQVNDFLQTTNNRVFAVGDCVGGPQFTHYAGWQGAQAVRNAIIPIARARLLNPAVLPRTTFTEPEVASFGITEANARKKLREGGVEVLYYTLEEVDRANTENDTEGFMKVVYRSNGKILGATIVAQRAGEAIAELANAMDQGIKITQLANTIHVYPTYSTGVQEVSALALERSILSGATGKFVELYVKAISG